MSNGKMFAALFEVMRGVLTTDVVAVNVYRRNRDIPQVMFALFQNHEAAAAALTDAESFADLGITLARDLLGEEWLIIAAFDKESP